MSAIGDRAFRALLSLYPADFRARYGCAMADFHRDHAAAARADGRSMTLFWLRATADAMRSALGEHAAALRIEESVMQTILYDLGFALRGLARRPAFTAIVASTIALGVGANAAIFSVVDGILLRPLPYPNAERVISFGHKPPQWLTSDANFLDYHREMRTLDGLAAFTKGEATLTSGDEPERVRVVRASDDFFPVLGVRPLLGRLFAHDEYRGNPPSVVVLSHGLWQRRFGGDPHIVGSTVSINGTPRTIVGVMPPRFDYPEARTDVWTPLPRLKPDSLGGRDNNYLFMVGRLRPTAALASTVAEANGIAQRVMRTYPELFDPAHPLVPSIARIADQLVGGTRPYLLALLGAVGFVLLIACANVANLLLVRGESRRREMALRGALGASRFRLLAQTLTESGLLTLLGGSVGLLIAWAGDRALIALAPDSIPRLGEIGIDWRVVAFTMVVVAATGLLIGLIPAWRASSGSAADALKDGGRHATQSGVAARARRALVVAEIALAMVTLTGAGMLVRSLWHLETAPLGFDPRGVLTAKVPLSPREYNDERAALFFDQLLSTVRALPGVTSAGASGWLPVVDVGGLWGVSPADRVYPPGQGPTAVPQQVTPGYFKSVGLPIRAGRDFGPSDRADAPFVVIVSRRLATMLWSDGDPLGRRIRLGGPSPWMTVVGVVDDILSRGFADTPEPTMYFPYAQAAKSAFFQPRTMALLVRTSGEPSALARTVREAVHAIDRTVPVSEIRTLEQLVGVSVANRRFSTSLLTGFALLALVLAGVGTYGVISFGVSQRTSEIGVRMALGAEQRSVLLLVLREGLRMCLAGLLVGGACSILVARSIRAMLVDVSFVDPPTLVAACVALVTVALLAASVPARRAMRVSPTDALRS